MTGCDIEATAQSHRLARSKGNLPFCFSYLRFRYPADPFRLPAVPACLGREWRAQFQVSDGAEPSNRNSLRPYVEAFAAVGRALSKAENVLDTKRMFPDRQRDANLMGFLINPG
jgi:hypothetical protein